MATEVITTYTETGDDGVPTTGILRETATKADFVAIFTNAAVYLAKDFGADYFSNSAFVEGEFNITAQSGTSAYRYVAIAFADTLGEYNSNTNVASMVLVKNDTVYNPRAGKIESSVKTSGGGVSNLSENTVYYYRMGFYSALGQYGAVLTQFYTDANRSTYASVALLQRTANANYRYFYPVLGVNDAIAESLTGYNENITIYRPPAGIDLTTGVETDTGTGRLAVYADCIVATALNIDNSETAKHVAIDEGVDFFEDYKVSGVLNITSFTNGAGTMFEILAVTDAAADAGAANDLQGIAVSWISSTTYKLYIQQNIGGTKTYSAGSETLNINRPYTVVLERSGTTLTLKVWHDLSLTNFVGTSQVITAVTWTGRATTKYRYLMPVASWLNGATSRSSTFTMGGVQRGGNPVVIGYGFSASMVRPVQSSTFNKEFSFTSESRLLPYSANTYTKVGVSDVITLLRVLSQSEGINPNAIRTYTRLMLTSSSSYTREGGASSAAREGKSATAITATKTSSGGTVGSLSVKTTITTIGYSGIFLKLITVRFTKPNATTGIQEPVSGLTPTLKVKRGTDAYSLDFDDDLFKASGWLDIDANLAETDPTNYPGVYNYFLQVNGFGDGQDIVYQLFVQDTTLGYYAEGAIVFRDGVEQWGGNSDTAVMSVVNALPTLAEIEGSSLLAKQAKLDFVEKWILNKLVESPSGDTVTLYDTDGVTPLKTWTWNNSTKTRGMAT